MTIACGVVGLGEMGSAHARNYLRNMNATLHAACDTNRERLHEFARRFPVKKLYTSVAEMCADPELKAVSVTVPNRWHSEVSIQLLKAGKSVLVEKPMAPTMGEAEEMLAAAKMGGGILQIGFMWRFHKDVRFVREAIAEGKLGKVFYVRYNAVTVGPPGGQTGPRLGDLLQRDAGLKEEVLIEALERQQREGGRLGEILVQMRALAEEQVRRAIAVQQAAAADNESWYVRKSIAMGGIVLDMGVHGIDTVRYLLGSPKTKSVFARTGNAFTSFWGSATDPVEDVAMILVEHEGGIQSTIECAWAPKYLDPYPEGRCVVVGSKGYASLFPTRVKYVHNGTWRTEVPVPSEPNDSLEMFQRQTEHFLECVESGKTPINHGLESIECVRISDAAYESSRKGAVVNL